MTQPTALFLADVLEDACKPVNVAEKAAAELRRLVAENEALRADAEMYRWLRDNSNNWSWNPSKYNDDVVSGFTASSTGYLGYSFAAAIDAARERT